MCSSDLKYFNFLNDKISEKFNDSDLFYDIKTDFEEEKLHYYEIIEKAKEYIKAGDIFQVVLSEQLKLTLYRWQRLLPSELCELRQMAI